MIRSSNIEEGVLAPDSDANPRDASAPIKNPKSKIQNSTPLLDSLVQRFDHPSFIATDPISIPHGFDDPRDQEVIGLFAALLAWGQRRTILNKMEELCERMRFQPYRFVRDFDVHRDATRLEGFKHRTFQPIDALWMTKNLNAALDHYGSVEGVFASFHLPDADHVGPAIQGFSETLLSIKPATPARLRKHLARPDTGSACKRLAMYLRWMVRRSPVDLGIWTKIDPSQLVLPLDVHSGRQARAVGLLSRPSNDWAAVIELTGNCRKLSRRDPARYDLALFGAGAHGLSLEPEYDARQR